MENTITVPNTTMVEFITSSLEGHCTFCSSALHSCKNVIAFIIITLFFYTFGRPGENRTPTKDFGDPSSTIKLQA